MDLEELLTAMPFAAASGVTLLSAAPSQVVGTLGWDRQRCTVGGVLHGGALMTLADSVGAVCAFLNLPAGTTTTTLTSTTSLLRAVRAGSVVATARPLSAGRTVIVVQTELRDGTDRLVAQTTQTQAVLPARP